MFIAAHGHADMQTHTHTHTHTRFCTQSMVIKRNMENQAKPKGRMQQSKAPSGGNCSEECE